MAGSVGEITSLLEDAAALAEDLGQTQIRAGLEILLERYLAQEWVMILLGETSSGKSTWINSLLGKAILPTAPGSTTSRVVEIRFHGQASPRFERLLPEGGVEEVDHPTFQQLCTGSGPLYRLRVWWPINLVHQSRGLAPDLLRGLVLFDTPGYNACLNEHVDLLEKVLPEADAVISMLNFDRGLTPQDVTFLKMVRGLLSGEDDCLTILAVNRVPASGGERRRAEMLDRLKDQLDLAGPLHTLPRHIGDGNVQCWSDSLWAAIECVAASADRTERIRRHTLDLLENALADLAQVLEIQRGMALADQAELERYQTHLQHQRTLAVQAETIVQEGRDTMVAVSDRILLEGRNGMWEEIKANIEDSGRLTEAKECAGYVHHLINSGRQKVVIEAERELRKCHDRLVERLEHLLLDTGDLPTPKASLDDPALAPLRRFMARRGIQQTAEGLFMNYLRRLGGRGGEKSGIVNLAKKLLSKTGNLFGKKFPRPVYDSMGGLLKRLGFSASKATTAVGAVIIELADYLYGVIRWKKSLKGLVQLELGLPAVDEPLEDTLFRKLKFWKSRKEAIFVTLQREWTTSITETMDETLVVIQGNYNRRVEVLEEALRARKDGTKHERIPEHIKALEILMNRCNELQGDPS